MTVAPSLSLTYLPLLLQLSSFFGLPSSDVSSLCSPSVYSASLSSTHNWLILFHLWVFVLLHCFGYYLHFIAPLVSCFCSKLDLCVCLSVLLSYAHFILSFLLVCSYLLRNTLFTSSCFPPVSGEPPSPSWGQPHTDQRAGSDADRRGHTGWTH